MKRTSSVDKFLRPLDDMPNQAYLTNELQVADILEWILEQVGTSDVYQTTFSISEEFLRRLYFLRKKSGKIRSLTVLLDRKATNKTLNLWQFIRQVVQDAYLADNHSKLLLVESADGLHHVSVITSQNLTRGNRSESSFVSTDINVFNTLKQQLDNLIEFHSVPIYDLFRRANFGYSEDGIGVHDNFGDGIDNADSNGGSA